VLDSMGYKCAAPPDWLVISDGLRESPARLHLFDHLIFCGRRRHRPNAWSKSEIKYLKDNFLTVPFALIAQRLNRTYCAIQSKLRELGLKKFPGNYIRSLEPCKAKRVA